MPTAEALRLHWLRCLWVLGLWNSSTINEVELPGKHRVNHLVPFYVYMNISYTTALTDYGWLKNGDKLEVQWDTPENVALAKQKVDYMLHGCECKTGCHSRHCGCKQQELWTCMVADVLAVKVLHPPMWKTTRL